MADVKVTDADQRRAKEFYSPVLSTDMPLFHLLSRHFAEVRAEGFSEGRAATLTVIAAELAEQAIREGQAGNVRAANVLDSYALTLSCANAENAGRAVIRSGEVRG